MHPVVLPEKGERAGELVRVREGDGCEHALDGDGVVGETGWGVLGDGDAGDEGRESGKPRVQGAGGLGS